MCEKGTAVFIFRYWGGYEAFVIFHPGNIVVSCIRYRTLLSLAFVLNALIITTSSYASSAVGQVIVVSGAVSATGPNGQVRVMAKGSPVFSGDRITTASKSLCVLKMVDDAKMTIRADSEIVIKEYLFEGSSDDKSVMDLLKGGFRTLTGIIGSKNPSAYEVSSELSVLGIRGTDYTTQLCEPGRCIQIGGSGPQYGQYTNVESGSVFMHASHSACARNMDDAFRAGCLIDIAAGQVGYVGLNRTMILPGIPDFILNNPTPSPVDISDSASPLDGLEGCQL